MNAEGEEEEEEEEGSRAPRINQPAKSAVDRAGAGGGGGGRSGCAWREIEEGREGNAREVVQLPSLARSLTRSITHKPDDGNTYSYVLLVFTACRTQV